MWRILRAVGKRVFKKIVEPIDGGGTHEEESQVKVRQACPSEDQLYRIVYELELQCELPEESLPTGPNSIPEYRSVDTGKQRTVEPPPPLRNELGDTGGNVGGGLGRLYVFESPRLLLLCHDFETKDSIFSEVHVPLEQSRLCGTSMHSLALEVAGEGSLTVGTIQQGLVSVGAEGSGKDGNITEDTLVCMRGAIVSRQKSSSSTVPR
jgi:hypothetical protein